MTFWKKVKYYALYLHSILPGGSYALPEMAAMKQENPSLPSTPADVGAAAKETVVKFLNSVWNWAKWILLGILILFILWAFFGRKS